MNNTLFYLAQPYWHQSVAVRDTRADYGAAATAHLLSHGVLVFSPIATGIAVKRFLHEERIQDHAFWMSVDLPMLARCDALLILPIEGWNESLGLREERSSAEGLGLPIYYLNGFVPGVGRLWPPAGVRTIESDQQRVFVT